MQELLFLGYWGVPSYLYMHTFINLEAFFFFPFPFRGETYGISQARGQIGAAAEGLHHSHSLAGSKPHLQPMLDLVAIPGP